MASADISEAERLQRAQAALKHGLRAADPAPAAVADAALALADRAELVRQVEGLYGMAAWVAHELQDAAVLSGAERMAVLYADVAGRAIAAAAQIRGGDVASRKRRPAADNRGDVERQVVVLGFLLAKTRGAHEWLRVNGATFDGKPRAVLSYYGEYLERSRRNALALAAMLSEGDDTGELTAGKVLESLKRGQD